MDKTDPPTSFGVFKPTGHTVIAFLLAIEEVIEVPEAVVARAQPAAA